MWHLAAIKDRDAHNSCKVQTTEEDSESEWKLHDGQNRSECAACVCGTYAEEGEEGGETTDKEERVKCCRLTVR